MSFITSIFEKVVVRRVSVWLAGIVIGWASNHWIASVLTGLDLDVNDRDGLTVAIAALVATVLGAIAEGVAWMRRQKVEGHEVNLQSMVAAASAAGVLQHIYDVAGPKLENVAKGVLADLEKQVAKKNALIDAGRIAKIIPIVLIVGSSAALGVDDPLSHPASLTLNTNTINSIVSTVSFQDPPAANFARIPDLIKFYGVSSMTGKGSAAGGAAAMVSLAQFKAIDETIALDIGPAYVIGMTKNDDFIQCVEIGFCTSFPQTGGIQAKLEKIVEGIPVFDLIPRVIDISEFQAFAGVGAVVGGDSGAWQPVTWAVSVGGGGIKFGKKK